MTEKWQIVKRGKGMLARVVRETTDAQTAYRMLATARRATFADKVSGAVAWAESILPPDQRPGGSDTRRKADSDEDQAFQILRLVHWINENIADNKAEEAAMQAFDLGVMLGRLEAFKMVQQSGRTAKQSESDDAGKRHADYRAAFAEDPSERRVAKRFSVSVKTVRRALGKK